MEAKSIKNVDQFQELRASDVIKIRIDGFPIRAKVMKNNAETRMVTLRYRQKRGKTSVSRVRVLSYNEILDAGYQDNTRKWIKRAVTAALPIATGGVIATQPDFITDFLKPLLELLLSL